MQFFLVAYFEVVAQAASDLDAPFVKSAGHNKSANFSADCLNSLIKSVAFGAPFAVTSVVKLV